jgi:hypothetical protein
MFVYNQPRLKWHALFENLNPNTTLAPAKNALSVRTGHSAEEGDLVPDPKPAVPKSPFS